jgi:hypothetical protein
VAVYDYGTTDNGLCYTVTEFIKGSDLAALNQQRRLSPREAAEIVAAVAEALHYVHTQGLAHRDVKPENILIDAQGRPRLADFGLALHEHDQPQRAGEVSGTYAYMAPEQVRGQAHHLDGRADVWALGVVFYELLTGRRPFQAATARDLCDEILHREPKPPRMIDDFLPRELEQVVLRCLQQPIADRYLTAADLAADLRTWLSSPNKNAGAAATSPIRRAVVWIGAALVLAILVLLTAIAIPRKRDVLPASAPALATETADLNVRVWQPGDPRRRGLSLSDPGALPLGAGDQVRVEARLPEPMYLYLVWIDAAGKAVPVYPWQEGDWSQFPQEQTPAAELSLPEGVDEGWEMDENAPPGMETLLLLTRSQPLSPSAAQRLFQEFEGLPMQTNQTGRSLVWFDQGEVSVRPLRAPKSFNPEKINDPVLQTQRLLRDRLMKQFEMIHGVSFAHRGE